MRKKILSIIKKHHLHHYGDLDSTLNELDSTLREDILKIVENAFDNNIKSSASKTINRTIFDTNTTIVGKENFLKEIKQKLNY